MIHGLGHVGTEADTPCTATVGAEAFGSVHMECEMPLGCLNSELLLLIMCEMLSPVIHTHSIFTEALGDGQCH